MPRAGRLNLETWQCFKSSPTPPLGAEMKGHQPRLSLKAVPNEGGRRDER